MAPPAPFPVPFTFSLDMFNGINSMLFQQSLQDLVKGIRAHRRDEDEFIRSKLTEITEECRSADVTKKTNAILKLTHLQMMGYNIAFARFHIVEVMSSPDFANKRIGYLGAAQSFSPTTDVLLLTTNQFKKDLTNGKLQDCSQALTCLAKIITEELGRDLEKDVSLLLTSPRPYIRKKALLVLYRLIMVHPDTLPIVSARFRERLTDSDPGVLCAAVTVTTELARASPSTFLSLAPVLYQLLTNRDSNNWMLIKIVKLMGVLTPLEPRLGKKLLEPLTTLMRTTRAKSLLYECCSTVTAGMLDHPEAVELCAQRLSEFMDESDQNLKYLGLLSMRRLIQAHPHLAGDHRDNILDCLDDEDIGIRMRALELVSEFVSKRNLRDISSILLRKLRHACANGFVVDESATLGAPASDTVPESLTTANASTRALSPNAQGQSGSAPLPTSPTSIQTTDQEAPYREALAKQLLQAGEYKRPSASFKGGYEMLSTADDFAWYLTCIIGGLSEICSLSPVIRSLISDQLLELTSRVEALRSVSVKIALSLLSMRAKSGNLDESNGAVNGDENDDPNEEDDDEDESQTDRTNKLKKSKSRPSASNTSLPASTLSATLAGNTAWILGEYAELIENYLEVVQQMINFPRRGLDAAAQVRMLTAAVKVYAISPDNQAGQIHDLLVKYVSSLINSQFAEVQDRAWFFNSVLTDFGPDSRSQMAPLFSGKLIPVDPRAQSKVPVSAELDLDTPLLDTGGQSIETYLRRSIMSQDNGEVDADDGDQVGGGRRRKHQNDQDDDEFDDEGSDLFTEAKFAAQALSLNVGRFPTDKNDETSIAQDVGSFVPVEQRDGNPFYLNASGADGQSNVAGGNDQGSMPSRKPPTSGKKSGKGKTNKQRMHDDMAERAARYGYDTRQLSSETAVVIAEENPLGLSLSDDETNDRPESKLESRLQEAFNSNPSAAGAPATSRRSTVRADEGLTGGNNVASASKKEKKKKKKKDGNGQAGGSSSTSKGSKKSKSRKASNKGNSSSNQAVLIDFGEDAVGQEINAAIASAAKTDPSTSTAAQVANSNNATANKNGVQPTHLADTLLM